MRQYGRIPGSFPGDEIYRITTQTEETVMFRINYRSDITTSHVIKYKDILYNITRVDVYEGYKRDLTLYLQERMNRRSQI